MCEPSQHIHYQVYLLRCWVENPPPGDEPVWRFSLESIGNEQRHGFTSLEALEIYIASQLWPNENNS